ncbi:MAG: ATP-binding cassette domain-containing protein [Paludibacteraceae bacterium]|nr:ATP-binding cassette domain-containing protein [Paludibacteraceae bacterium]
MEKIELKKVLPRVFNGKTNIQSDIWGQDVCFEKGTFYLVEADSGTGKSSLCSYLYGYRNDYEGTIQFDQTDIAHYPISRWVELRRRHIALLWQELRLFPELTAWENVQIKNQMTGFRTDLQIAQWFEQLGIGDKRNSLIGQMSYGQQQRVALMRTLCQPADFIFADEPISHLDDQNSRQMAALLTQEAKRQGAAVITTSIGKRLELDYDTTYKL